MHGHLGALVVVLGSSLLVACVADANSFGTEPGSDAGKPMPMGDDDSGAMATSDSGSQASDASADKNVAWSVPSIAGLSLWLDGSKGVTVESGAVSKWSDQSGNGNDAVQQNPSFRPYLSSGTLNARDALFFKKTGTPIYLDVPSPKNMNWTGDFFMMFV